MAAKSLIEWTNTTWNPVTGCKKISPGCRYCYAERLANRLKAMGNPRYHNVFRLTVHQDLLNLPLKFRQPRMIFANSMSDLLCEQVPSAFVKAIFSTMTHASWHTFQVLTKRAERLAKLAPHLPWPNNIWMGVSIECQDYEWRTDYLRQVPAKIRFISCEPLLGPIKLRLEDIHWVIVGGESGPGARPMEIEWVRSIREQCIAVGVPFFLKQWGGEWDKHGKDKALLDGKLWRQWPCQDTAGGNLNIVSRDHPSPLFAEDGITTLPDTSKSRALVK